MKPCLRFAKFEAYCIHIVITRLYSRTAPVNDYVLEHKNEHDLGRPTTLPVALAMLEFVHVPALSCTNYGLVYRLWYMLVSV